MTSWLAALVLFAQAPGDLAGLYQTQQIEVGAALELRADGTFRYSLDYGAVSEAAEGRWSAKDGVVHLDSKPMALELLRDIERGDAGFTDEQLAVDGGALVLQRWDTIFTFYKDEQ